MTAPDISWQERQTLCLEIAKFYGVNLELHEALEHILGYPNISFATNKGSVIGYSFPGITVRGIKGDAPWHSEETFEKGVPAANDLLPAFELYVAAVSHVLAPYDEVASSVLGVERVQTNTSVTLIMLMYNSLMTYVGLTARASNWYDSQEIRQQTMSTFGVVLAENGLPRLPLAFLTRRRDMYLRTIERGLGDAMLFVKETEARAHLKGWLGDDF